MSGPPVVSPKRVLQGPSSTPSPPPTGVGRTGRAPLRVVGTVTVTGGTASGRRGGASGVSTDTGTRTFTRPRIRPFKVSGSRTITRDVSLPGSKVPDSDPTRVGRGYGLLLLDRGGECVKMLSDVVKSVVRCGQTVNFRLMVALREMSDDSLRDKGIGKR